MRLDGTGQVTGVHSATVIRDTDKFPAPFFYGDIDPGRSGINGVFHQLLQDACRPLDHFAGGDHVDHVVVKDHPEPITNFDGYKQDIKADRRISDILAPRECLVPKLSIVLKKVPAFAKFMDKSHGDEEKTCINRLKAYPEFQDFLKIAGSFAYFMDLSKYFFLGEILNECYDTAGMIEKEFKKHQDLIWIPASFTDRYGESSTDLCFELQNLFNRFDNQLNKSTHQAF